MLPAALTVTFLIGVATSPLAQTPQEPACPERLAKLGIIVMAAPRAGTPEAAACQIKEPVKLVSVSDPGAGPRLILFPDRPLLSCPMAERFARFAADMAAPLALGIHGSALATVATGPGHECRPRNRQPGAKMSSHAQGDAVDIAQVTLASGYRILVETPQGPHDLRFLAGLRAAACGAFSTVLGPGSDAAHANHIHLDIESRGRDGQSKFCQ